MDEALRVRRVERARDLVEDVQGTLERQRAIRVEVLAQVGAIDVAHGDVVVAVRLVGLVDRDDVRVVDASGHARFAYKALAEALVLRELGREQLERHLPAEVHVLGAVDDAHAATPYVVLDPVRTEVRSNLHLRHHVSRVTCVRPSEPAPASPVSLLLPTDPRRGSGAPIRPSRALPRARCRRGRPGWRNAGGCSWRGRHDVRRVPVYRRHEHVGA